MGILFLSILSIYVAAYCFSYGKTYVKNGNKSAATAYFLMVMLSLSSPFIFFFGR
ncbi:hypothetical protein GH741_21305 [Aquibacillus halophilus]|uniref:Uncharacterized protein n=1 Tax=Aquibacillus halophilus TaxID=930132 RepID=A0A6A8DQ05_9BACI|nr:hypothetical protein [Aquibacillus halophilus]MRH45167.1 hypothetical protein [Aquibacillus halophilus]